MNKKQKIQGVDNKELLLFGVIIGIIIILLMYEMFFFKGNPKVIEESAEVQQQLEEMQNTTVVSEQRTVYHALNDILGMMNDKDYEGLYSMLKDDYKNYYFADYETFKEFIEIYAGQRYYPKYSAYYRNGDLYYIMVDFLREKYTREDLLKQKVTKVDTIVLQELEDGNFKFAMNGFVENIEHNSGKTVNGVTFKLQNSVRNTETMKTTVLIKNDSTKPVSVSTTNIQPDISGGNSAKVSATTSVNLAPGELGALSIEYYFQYNSGRTLNGINITGVEFNDGTLIEDVFLSK